MPFDLTDANVLVTGSSRGIGRAITESVSEAGGTVGVHYRESEEEARALADRIGRGATVFRADFTEDVAPTAAFLLSGAADHATGSKIDINAGSYIH